MEVLCLELQNHPQCGKRSSTFGYEITSFWHENALNGLFLNCFQHSNLHIQKGTLFHLQLF